MGNIKGYDYCYIGDLSIMSDLDKTHLTGCIGEIISFHRSLMDEKILYIHEYLMKSGELQIQSFCNAGEFPNFIQNSM